MLSVGMQYTGSSCELGQARSRLLLWGEGVRGKEESVH